jgi:hypothetical protein
MRVEFTHIIETLYLLRHAAHFHVGLPGASSRPRPGEAEAASLVLPFVGFFLSFPPPFPAAFLFGWHCMM